MEHLFQSYAWCLSHRVETVGLFALLVALSFIVGALIRVVWISHEKRTQQAQRERLEKVLQASTPPRDWPTTPHGFDRQRRAS